MGYAGYHAVESDVEVGIVPAIHFVIILIIRKLFMHKVAIEQASYSLNI